MLKNKRNYLEKWLEDTITQNNLESVKLAVRMVKAEPQSSLASCNPDGKSFLAQAISQGATNVYSYLLEELKDNTELIFNKDKLGRSLISYAAEKNYVNVLQTIFNLSSHSPSQVNSQLYKEFDKQGLTPLHYATQRGNFEAVQFLIQNLVKDTRTYPAMLCNLINQADANGDTYLHHACSPRGFHVKIIASLINYGADLNVKNNSGITPLHLLFKFLPEENIEIFDLLNKNKKEIMLSLFNQYLIKNPQANDIKKLYFQFAAKKSLFALLVAHHEFNEDFPIRNTFQRWERIPEEIKEKIPLYAIKVRAEEKRLNRKENRPEFVNSTFANSDCANLNTSQVSPPTDYMLVNQDREKLNSLIAEIQICIAELENKRHLHLGNMLQVLGSFYPLKVLPPLILFAYSLTENIESALAVSVEEKNSHFFRATMSLLAASYLTLMWRISCYSNGERNISSNELKILADKLEVEVIQKLVYLEKLEKTEKLTNPAVTHLPVDADILTKLKAEIPHFNHSQTTTEGIELLNQVKTLLETTRMQLNLSNKPLSGQPTPPRKPLTAKPISSQFFKAKSQSHVAVDIPDENAPLLPQATTQRRCIIL